jgi:hypothetical protein
LQPEGIESIKIIKQRYNRPRGNKNLESSYNFYMSDLYPGNLHRKKTGNFTS